MRATSAIWVRCWAKRSPHKKAGELLALVEEVRLLPASMTTGGN